MILFLLLKELCSSSISDAKSFNIEIQLNIFSLSFMLGVLGFSCLGVIPFSISERTKVLASLCIFSTFVSRMLCILSSVGEAGEGISMDFVNKHRVLREYGTK
jgi:hypothetical protein